MPGIKTTEADRWFSKCVRMRSNWKCERCGAQHDQSSMGLHCSHNFGRRARSVRWEPLNALSLCMACHNWYAEEPPISGQWLSDMLGDDMNRLIQQKNTLMKIPKAEEKAIAKHYREEFRRMEKLRESGHTGRLEFVSYYEKRDGRQTP